MNEYEEKIMRNIDKHGCHVTHVMADDEGPSFTYSTGIQKCTGQPEIILTGLDKDTSHFLVNEYNARIKDGETFKANETYGDFLEGHDVIFKIFDPKHYPDYLVSSMWLYDGDDFQTLQMIWPDVDGTWPWEKKAEKDYRWLIPRLYIA